MRTVAETAIFQRYAAEIWLPDEKQRFIDWIAANPEAGAVIPGSGACRKVRWAAQGSGKRGGARVIYFLQRDETVWLLIAYTKSAFDTLPANFLAQLRKAIEDEF